MTTEKSEQLLLQVSEGENVVPVLLELHQLRVLDISDEKDAHPFEMFHPSRTRISELLKTDGCLQHLTNLDISGKYKYTMVCLKIFIDSYQLIWPDTDASSYHENNEC